MQFVRGFAGKDSPIPEWIFVADRNVCPTGDPSARVQGGDREDGCVIEEDNGQAVVAEGEEAVVEMRFGVEDKELYGEAGGPEEGNEQADAAGERSALGELFGQEG